MTTLKKLAARAALACVAILSLAASAYAWEPNTKDLDAAISTGDFTGYFANLTAWLGQKLPAKAGDISEAGLKALLADPAFVNALDQRRLIGECGLNKGTDKLGAFAKSDEAHRTFLSWLMKNTAAMDLYLEGGGANAGERSINALALWSEFFHADADSREGIYLRLAIATALNPPPAKSYGSGVTITPLSRYQHFKAAHKNHELYATFDTLTVWEYGMIVSSWASDSDLAWVRQMVNTWRPDLIRDQKVINIVSEVWRRSSPFPFSDGFVTVMAGGGKCGPRSWFGAMTCQAFGIPAQAMGQPAHSAIAAKAADPQSEPQPGRTWKMYYGRDWPFTHGGSQFLSEAEARSHAVEFSQAEHLRWLAAAGVSKEQAAAVTQVAAKILPPSTEPFPGMHPASQASAQQAAKSTIGKTVEAVSSVQEPSPAVAPGVIHMNAADFTKKSGVNVYDSATGGKQVNFGKSIQTSWVDYSIDVPESGTYAITLRVATPNREQVFDLTAGNNQSVQIKIPDTHGLWATTDGMKLKLEKGTTKIRISAPFQRGVAVRWLELKPE